MKMSSSPAQEQISSERRNRPRRAEREIYRPGALRQLKEISVSQTRSPVSEKLKNDTILKKNNEFDDLNSNIIIKPNISQAASEATKEISSSGLNCKQGSQSSVNSQSVNIKCGSYDKRKKERPSLNSNSHFSVSKQSECILPKKLDFGNDGNSNFPHKLEYKRSKKSFADLDSYRSKHSPDKTKKNNKPFNNHSKAKFSGNEAGGQKRDAKTNKFNERPKIDSSKLNLNERGQAKVKTKEELGKQEKPTDASSSQTPMKIVETRKSNNNVCGNKSGSSQNKNENNSKLVEKSDTGNKLEPNKMDLFNYNKKRGGGRSRNNSNHRHYEVSKRNKEHKKCEVVPKDKNVEGSKPSEKSNNINFPPKSSTGNKQVKASSIGCKGESKSDLKAETSIGSKEADPVSQSEIIRYIENIDLGPSSEETTSENEDYGNGRYQKAVNPMIYIDFEATSFYESSHDSKYIANKKNLKTSPHSQNVAWADEKWSPAQRQRKKKGKNNKESSHAESPGRRGIIQINNSPSNYETQSETVTTGQRLLFNPNNPSKPVAVMPSARDLHPSRDHPHGASDKDKNLEEAPAGPSWNESNTDTEGTGSLDPSIFYSIQKGEFDINYFVNSNQLPQEFRRIMDIRLHLQGCYKQLLISDIRLCQEKNVEGALWKSLYYIIIEKLREYIGREPTLKERSLSTLMMIVEEGLGYLQSLLTAIQKAYRFSLEAHFEEDLTTLPGTKNRVRHALYSCQKILLSMGDLARYGEQYNSSPNYLHAKKWYEMALQVNPRNGRPFNQLAIIAVSQKRSLDVVYYYIRSLTASNPFTSARDSLISMFDDIRRKYESMNINKHSSDTDSKHQNPRPEEHQSRRRDGNLRQEIWIRPDSGATNKRTLSQSDPEEEKKSRIEELLRMPQDQLMKQFLTSYLHCHGMLFSRVGLDRFGAVLGETLNLFQALLQLLHPKLSPTHLLQIMAINMYAVDNTQLRDARLESGYRSAAQDLALLLSQEMFSRLTEVMVKLFPASLNYTSKDSAWNPSSPKDEASASSGSLGSLGVESQRLFQTPLTHFVPAAKVWCDWLLYQSSVWNPPPISHDFSGVDTWGVIGELATIVKGIGPPDVTLTEDGPSHFVTPVTLPEDVFLRGYTPIVSAQMGGHYAPRNVNKERAQDWVRVKKFQLCLSQFLCGVEPPVLRLQKTDQGEILVSIVTVSPPDSPTVARSSIGSCEVDFEDSNSEVEGSNSDDDGDLGAAVDVGGDDTPLASTVRLLARRKKILEKRQRQQRKMQAILEGAVTLEMEVKPRYLVPDTNCFIEKLSIIKALIDNTNYTFMVPLIVLAELDGLSRDAAVEKYGDATHAVNVREGAATALLYIQSNKNPRLKCVTSQGSVAPANMFSLEMDTLKDITNDDKILSCCLHLCSDTNKRRPIKEGVRRLYREVVLLTEDRNLRVKAYARDVPVRELSDFAHWAGVK